jgi:hypothetical protein
MRESEPESIISGSFFLREDAERSRARGGATIRRESKFRVINSLATPDPHELTLLLREWGKGNRYEQVKPIRAWRRPMESECFSGATSRQAKHLNTTVGG